MKDPRTIPVKMLVNSDEFVEFSTACDADDISHSKQLRDLARNWLNQRNRKARQERAGRAVAGQNLAMFLPGRSTRSLRLRN